MTPALFLGLGLVCLYMAKRWRDSSSENTDLRNQVASLKRQLRRTSRSGTAAG